MCESHRTDLNYNVRSKIEKEMPEADRHANAKNLTVGMICQPILPDLLAPLCKAVIYQQLAKLINLVGRGRVDFFCSLNGPATEIGVVTALELGFRIRLLPAEEIESEDRDRYLKCCENHRLLMTKPNVTSESLSADESNAAQKIIEESDVLIMAYDQQDPKLSKKFKDFENQYFDSENYMLKNLGPTEAIREVRLAIRINVPCVWDKDADEMVYFDYIARRSITEKPMAEIEIPPHIVHYWQEALSGIRH